MKNNIDPLMSPMAKHPAHEVCLRISAQSGVLAEDPEFAEFIEHGTTRITPRILALLVCEMPDIREKLQELEDVGLPQAGAQLAFLADVVEESVLQNPLYYDLPCTATLEAAFALQYFHRAIDLIPDSLGAIGYSDDAAVAAAVIARHSEAFEKLAHALHLNWAMISPAKPHTR